MQIRHAKPGDEAQLAFLLEDNQRHYGHAVEDGSGAGPAAYLSSHRLTARSVWSPTITASW